MRPALTAAALALVLCACAGNSGIKRDDASPHSESPAIAVPVATPVQAPAARRRLFGDATALAMKGQDLTPDQVAEFEAKIAADPQDVDMRTVLIGHYFSGQFDTPQYRQKASGHVLWLIENEPEAPVLGTPFGQMDSILDAIAYSKATALWSEVVEHDPDNIAVLSNAAAFHLLGNEAESERLYMRLRQIEPRNAEWNLQLAQLHALNTMGWNAAEVESSRRKAFEFQEAALKLTTDSYSRYVELGDAATFAFQTGEASIAESHAKELLELAAARENDWNFANALHQGHSVLGRLALKAGDREQAREHLLASVRHAGSPQLDSFGPDFTFAQEMLDAGESEAVLEHLNLCREFWKMDGGKLSEWRSQIEAGQKPRLSRF